SLLRAIAVSSPPAARRDARPRLLNLELGLQPCDPRARHRRVQRTARSNSPEALAAPQAAPPATVRSGILPQTPREGGQTRAPPPRAHAPSGSRRARARNRPADKTEGRDHRGARPPAQPGQPARANRATQSRAVAPRPARAGSDQAAPRR